MDLYQLQGQQRHDQLHQLLMFSPDYSMEVIPETKGISTPSASTTRLAVMSHDEKDIGSEQTTPSSIGSGPFQDGIDLVSQSALPPPEPSECISEGEEALLPLNWSVTTNSNGRIYYFNVITKESSWKRPSVSSAQATASLKQETHANERCIKLDNGLAHEERIIAQDTLPHGWNSACDEDGSMYFFNASTGETTWDKPTNPGAYLDSECVRFQSPEAAEQQGGQFDVNFPLMVPITSPNLYGIVYILQTLNQLPSEDVDRRGSLRVKSQKVTANTTISSWKDYWVVVYKGFLLFYRDDSGAIKGAYSLKASSDTLSKIRHATQAKPSGCFDAGKVSVELATKEQALTKKKNVFHITPGTNVRLLLQDSTGNDVMGWVRDIQASLANRRHDESLGTDQTYLVKILRRQTSGGGEASGLKMNKKIEEKEMKSANKSLNPLKLDKARGIRSIVAQGIHVPRRKSTQDERLRLPDEDTLVEDLHDEAQSLNHQKGTAGRLSTTKRTSSREQSKDLWRDSEQDSGSSIVSNPIAGVGAYPSSTGGPGVPVLAAQNTKAKLSNMSRNFFSKDKDSDKTKDRPKDKGKDKHKDKEKEKDKDKDNGRDSKKTAVRSTQVFGGSLTVEPGMSIPRVVELCVESIEARGLSTAGIYRVSGHMSSIQNLKRAFNEGQDVERLIAKEPDVNNIAALLKLYFRELKEPLMLFDFYPSFISAADIEDYNEKLYTIKSLVHSLPAPNFDTLQYLMMHLGRIQGQYQTTKMDSANLAICFAPNLLRQEVDDLTSIINTGKQSSIVDTLIEQREWVFDPYPEDEDEEEDEEQLQHDHRQQEVDVSVRPTPNSSDAHLHVDSEELLRHQIDNRAQSELLLSYTEHGDRQHGREEESTQNMDMMTGHNPFEGEQSPQSHDHALPERAMSLPGHPQPS
ncbi:Rho GTPase-activating protein 12 [Podila humilis]|nr:Rho GTPase-activating protein 12 [Podila humilis]